MDPDGDERFLQVEEENEGEPAPVRRLVDLEQWLQQNGLRSANDELPPSQELAQEARARLEEHQQYEQQVHQAIFCEAQQQPPPPERQQRLDRLRQWTDRQLVITTSHPQHSLTTDLLPLAATCETVYTLAATWGQQFAGGGRTRQTSTMALSLDQFPASSVQDFVGLVQRIQCGSTSTGSFQEIGMVMMTNPTDVQLPLDAFSDQIHIVDACRMAHYLQNAVVLDATVDILMNSIDTNNAWSLCQLADQLGQQELFERSLRHVMESLQNDLQEQEAWNDLSPELQQRIVEMQTVLQQSSSLFSDPSSATSCARKLYFGSMTEYLAIFAENVEYHKERLLEAKEQQQSLLAQRHPDSRLASNKTRGWMDAQTKINRQEVRVRTLETAFRQQKELFSKRQKT